MLLLLEKSLSVPFLNMCFLLDFQLCQEYVVNVSTKSKEEKEKALSESFMIAKLGGEAAFLKAKQSGEIQAVEDEETGKIYWAARSLEISKKQEVKSGSTAGGKQHIGKNDLENIQAWYW